MPFFRYSASDPHGQRLEGTLVAADEAEARVILQHRGLPHAVLMGSNTAAPAPIAAPPVVAQPLVSPPIARQATPTPVASPVAPTTGVVRTKKGTDKHRFFLFAQFSRLLKAGINPARAFDEVGRVTPYEHFKGSFRELSDDATNGRNLSATMERYPDLYPDHVVGMIRAGETGGFLPDAFMTLADQAEEAYKFKRFHWFIWYLAPRALVAVPLAFAAIDALIIAYKRTDTFVSPSVWSVFLEKLIWPYGPIILAIGAAMLLLRWWLSTHRMRRFRHAMGLKMPIYGPRARNESISLFTWTLSKLSRAGISPHRSWQLATEAVPNLEMQARLTEAAARMESNTRLSEVIFGSKLFPDEYAPILSTGELTGDLTGALDQLERVSRTEFEETTRKAKWGSMRIGLVFAIVTSGAVCITLTYGYYHKFYGAVLEDYQWSEE